MPRIPSDELDRLKREVSLERLAEARGIQLVRRGRSLMGLCPFHQDRNPSLSIDPAKNVWNCLGACGAGGDVIEWVMRAEGVSFKHAVELLKRDYLPSAGAPPRVSTVPKLPPLFEPTLDDRKLLEAVVSFYHETLKQTPEAQQYLIKRGLQSAEMIERFQLGFSNRTLGYRLPEKNRAAGAVERGRLEELGIFRPSGHEHFVGSLTIPIVDLNGEVVQMYGRKINSYLRPGTEYHLYLPGPRRGVWNEEALVASKDIILCEALIDALTFWCAGFRNVTASYGVNGFNDYHREALRKHGTRRVYIAYDRDDAGEKAAAKLAEELIGMGIECFRVQFPKGQDANEYASTTTPAAKALGVLLNGAAWLGTGKRPAVETQRMEKPEPAAKEECAPTEPRPMPLATPLEPRIEIDGEEIDVTLGPRTYRVLGLEKNTSRGAMKVNVRVWGANARGEWLCHGDTLDMEMARQRAAFVKQAAHELAVKEETVQREVGRLWTALGDIQRQQIQKAREAASPESMTEEERTAALALLRDPRLMDRILEDFVRCGVVGEETNKKVAYLGAVSRLLDKPLAIVVQSSSSAGKSSLMEAVLDFMPEEQREQYSAMTGQALFYMGQKDLKHKILAVAEEEGASRAAYALKLLQSEGVLKIASTGKDPVTGKLVTHEYTVEGPVMIFLTTTAHDVDEELLNRSIVLTVNEDREQTRAIHQKQREAQTVEGLWAREERAGLIRLHRNAQRLLRPIHVVNEHIHEQAFPDYMIRTRRDHMKFLTLVQAIALLYQHQREIKTSTRRGKTLQYIEATAEDVKLAGQLVSEVLTPSLDELRAQTRRLLLLIDRMVTEECRRQEIERGDYRFTRATLRQYTRWGDTQLRMHLRRLEELEYLVVRHGGPGQTFVYQLHFELDAEGKPVLAGLGALCGYDGNRAGENDHCAATARAGSGGIAGAARVAETRMDTGANGDFARNRENRVYTRAGAM
jgi:DNA primase